MGDQVFLGGTGEWTRSMEAEREAREVTAGLCAIAAAIIFQTEVGREPWRSEGR